MILLKIFSVSSNRVSSPSCIPSIPRFGLSIVPKISRMFSWKNVILHFSFPGFFGFSLVILFCFVVLKFYFCVKNCFYYFIQLFFYSWSLLKDLFTSSLRSLNIFIIVILTFLSYASTILNLLGSTVVELLHSGRGILSWLFIFMLCYEI